MHPYLDPDLAVLRPLGGFFVLRTLAADADGSRAALPTLGRVYADPPPDAHWDPLALRVRKVAGALRTPQARVAASIAHLGLAARLWSAALGCAVLYGGVPDLDPRLLHWDPDAAAPDDLWLAGLPRPLPGDAGTLAAAVLDGHLRPLARALTARHRLPAGLLWGNAGSALAGAARELERWARANGREDAAERARSLTAELFARAPLAGTGAFGDTGFRRRSCCLYYRAPGGGVCGDCCFTRPPRSSARGASG